MKRYLPLVVLVATLTFALSPLASTGFNGFTPDQFPVVQNDPPVQPAGYAFSIWGLIYAWLIVGAGYGFWRAAEDPGWQAMRTPLAVSLTVGTFWIAAANAAPILATVMIVAMAVLAILAMLRAGHRQPWLQVRPVALYAGWLTAASGVGIGVLLGGYAILSAQSAAILCLIGVLAVALAVQSAHPREWGYPAAVVWALVGVIVQNAPSNWPVIILAALGIAALMSRTLFSVIKGPNT
ncbi:tryptophan-rich sensory protein [Octadecabacter ascidiaceicola]|uniref:Seryl-tRNA synthetase n=1 Tax=Octadecabacter ascidiaceicola TaxID=1655543 RepID=A0A238KKA0_9RHOB|nr:tryptophan-rich sensory protein [Octadecabacter ascidiaceicola]SMX43138.1 hypothetical protein OCA8868_02882 [Octadecabacter ascidiaceicola]